MTKLFDLKDNDITDVEVIKPIAETNKVYERGCNPSILHIDEFPYVESGCTPSIEHIAEPTITPEDTTLAKLNSLNGNEELFKNINNIVLNNKPKEKITYFVSSSGILNFDIDYSSLRPSSLTMLSGKSFEDKYLKQLEAILFNNKENLDTSQLMSIIQLYNLINTKKYPINIKSHNNKKQVVKITNALNTYFNDNLQVIRSMFTMFNSNMKTEKEANQANEQNVPILNSPTTEEVIPT